MTPSCPDNLVICHYSWGSSLLSRLLLKRIRSSAKLRRQETPFMEISRKKEKVGTKCAKTKLLNFKKEDFQRSFFHAWIIKVAWMEKGKTALFYALCFYSAHAHTSARTHVKLMHILVHPYWSDNNALQNYCSQRDSEWSLASLNCQRHNTCQPSRLFFSLFSPLFTNVSNGHWTSAREFHQGKNNGCALIEIKTLHWPKNNQLDLLAREKRLRGVCCSAHESKQELAARTALVSFSILSTALHRWWVSLQKAVCWNIHKANVAADIIQKLPAAPRSLVTTG